MENLFFLRIEIIIFLISIIYFIYYIIYKIKTFTLKKYRNNKQISKKSIKNKVSIKETKFQRDEKKEINADKKVKISDLLRKEAVYYERGDYETAK
jgi:hypothetical protein